MASMSRWFVGSSSSSTSGCPTRARASSARRRHPPDRVSTRASAGRPRRDSTISTRCSRRHPSRSSNSWCNLPKPLEGLRRRRVGHLDGGVVVVVTSALRSPKPLGDDVEHRLVGRDRHVLLEARDADTRLPGHGALVHRVLTTDDPQQRGLPRPVAAEDADAFPGVDGQRDIVEQGDRPEGERDVIEGHERHVDNRTTDAPARQPSAISRQPRSAIGRQPSAIGFQP